MLLSRVVFTASENRQPPDLYSPQPPIQKKIPTRLTTTGEPLLVYVSLERWGVAKR